MQKILFYSEIFRQMEKKDKLKLLSKEFHLPHFYNKKDIINTVNRFINQPNTPFVLSKKTESWQKVKSQEHIRLDEYFYASYQASASISQYFVIVYNKKTQQKEILYLPKGWSNRQPTKINTRLGLDTLEYIYEIFVLNIINYRFLARDIKLLSSLINKPLIDVSSIHNQSNGFNLICFSRNDINPSQDYKVTIYHATNSEMFFIESTRLRKRLQGCILYSFADTTRITELIIDEIKGIVAEKLTSINKIIGANF